MIKMKINVRYTSRTPQVLRKLREIELSEQELQSRLDRLSMAANGLNPTASDLLDYCDGLGEFANFVGLAARQDEVQALFDRLAECVYYSEVNSREIGQEIIEDGDEVDFRYDRARTIRG
jgi:hypothetical protein